MLCFLWAGGMVGAYVLIRSEKIGLRSGVSASVLCLLLIVFRACVGGFASEIPCALVLAGLP